MDVFSNVFKFEKRSTSQDDGLNKAINSDSLFNIFPFGASGAKAGVKSAFTISAFYNAVDQISNDVAKLPKHVYVKDGENRFKDDNHPIAYLIQHAPNNMMTAYDFWKVVTVRTIIKGNCYVEIIRNKVSGRIEAFLLRDNEKIEVFKGDNLLLYKYKGRDIDSDSMLHFKGFSFDGILGTGIVTFAAKQLGVTLSAQEYANEVYTDRGIGYGVIESDVPVEAKNKKMMEEGFSSKMTSGSKFKIAALDEGMKFKSISITPAEAQFLETNKNGVIEVCRWLNIAPHKLKMLDNASFSNIYHQSIEHVQDSILPWSKRQEQELDIKCFTETEIKTRYVKYNEKFLLRGDLDAKQKFYTAGIYSGFITRNEVRSLEDMNPIEGLEEPLQPVNMQALSVAMKILEDQQNT